MDSGLILATASPTMWYLTRAAAVSAYVLLSLAVMLGILQSLARTSHERISWVVDELHQFVVTLAFVMVVAHLVTLALDPFLPFTFINFLVPTNEPYRQIAVDYGVFALYSMTLVIGSSWLRRHIPYSLWRSIHYLGIVMFAAATAHGWLAGSDVDEPWMHGIYVGSSAAVAFLVLLRIIIRPHSASSSATPITRI